MRLLRFIDRKIIGFIFHLHLYKMLFFEFLPFFFGGVVVVVVFMGGNAILFNMLDHIVSKHVPPAVYVKVLLLQMPSFLVMGLPMATIFGALMAFGRLSRDNELDAMRTSWVVAWRMLIFTIICVGMPITAGNWYLIHKVAPNASRQSLDIWKKFLVQEVTGRPMSNVFLQGLPGDYFFISSFDPASGRIGGVTVYSTNPESQYPRLIVAPAADWSEKYIFLRNARIYEVKSDGMLKFDATAQVMRINVQQHLQQMVQGLDTPLQAGISDPANPGKPARPDLVKTRSLETDLMLNMSMNMTDAELRQQIAAYKSFGMDTKSLETNLHFKKSIPFSCLVCIILAVPISIGGARAGQGTMRNMALILALMSCYYISTIVTIAMGHSGIVSPWLSAWSQNMLFAAVGLSLSIWYMRK